MRPASKVAAIAVLAAFAACAPGTDGARQAITAANQMLAASSQSLVQFDAEYQKRIVETAPSLEAGKAALADYRSKRAAVVKVLFDAAALVAAGPPLLAMVDLGMKKSTDVQAWLLTLSDALGRVTAALAAFGVPMPLGGR